MDSLAESLLDYAHQRKFEGQPFFQRIAGGTYTIPELAVYAKRFYFMAESFPIRLCTLMAKTPLLDVRVHLLENLMEEQGMVVDRETCKVVYEPLRRHPFWIKHFAKAVGNTEEELSWNPSLVGGTWVDRAMEDGNWVGALAYMTIGIESNVPRTFKVMVPALRANYGFTDKDIRFFIEHITADEAHGATGAELVAYAARETNSEQQAWEGVKKGSAEWWAFHRRCDTLMRERSKCA